MLVGVVVGLLAPAGATAADSIYWSNAGSSKIRVGNLNGSGTPADLFSSTEPEPYGVAIDPAAGRIYWANYDLNLGKIRVGNLNGSGTPVDLFSSSEDSSQRRSWRLTSRFRSGRFIAIWRLSARPVFRWRRSEGLPVATVLQVVTGRS